jgi:nicotinamide mononucleotide transporter
MSWLEWVAAGLGVINVALVVRRSVWNYPFGLAMVALYFFVFYQARLYSDALLQIFFVVVQIYGWVSWMRSRTGAGEVPVSAMTLPALLLWSAGTILASFGWGILMARYTNAVAPIVDAFIAGFSISAQILMARRKIENWILWIMVDIVAIALYFHRDLRPTSALYVLFLILSIAGLVGWRRAVSGLQAGPPAQPGVPA